VPSDAQAFRSYAGRFKVTRQNTSVVLSRDQGALVLLFTDAIGGDLPAAVEHPKITELAARTDPERVTFEIRSSANRWLLEARSLQVHERVELYGTAISLPRFALRERILWTLLLWAARFEWGQALIGKLTGASRRS